MRVARWPTSNASRHTAHSASLSAAAAASSSADVRARNAEMASLAAAEARLPSAGTTCSSKKTSPSDIARAAASDTASVSFRGRTRMSMPCSARKRACGCARHQVAGSASPRGALGERADRLHRVRRGLARRAVELALELAGKLAFERRRRLFSSRDRVASGSSASAPRLASSDRCFRSRTFPKSSREALFAAQRLGEQLVAVHPRGAPVVSRSEHHACAQHRLEGPRPSTRARESRGFRSRETRLFGTPRDGWSSACSNVDVLFKALTASASDVEGVSRRRGGVSAHAR